MRSTLSFILAIILIFLTLIVYIIKESCELLLKSVKYLDLQLWYLTKFLNNKF